MFASKLNAVFAVCSITLSGTETFRVACQFAQLSLELLSALVAFDGCPFRRHSHGGMVVADVICPSSEFKVFKTVIVLDSVDVVNVIVGSEIAPNMLCHNFSMFKYVEAISGDLNVPVAPYLSGDCSVSAFARTEAHISACGS